MDYFARRLEESARQIHSDYGQARQHWSQQDVQRAGHHGEATWVDFLNRWAPSLPIRTRKYIVGPGGESNEIDIIMLKRDYPEPLRDQASILVSGVAAAFSAKLTLRPADLMEAVSQKRSILRAAGHLAQVSLAGGRMQAPDLGDLRRWLVGPFPFGLLAHSSKFGRKHVVDTGRSPDDPMWDPPDVQAVAGRYADLATRIHHPHEDLDAVLIADSLFFSMRRVARDYPDPQSGQLGSPSSGFWRTNTNYQFPGAPLLGFVTWLHRNLTPSDGWSALQSMELPLGSGVHRGYAERDWPMSIYPSPWHQMPFTEPDGRQIEFL